MYRRLTKSENQRILCGVCGGIGEFFGIDPTIIRIAFVIMAFAGSAGIWISLLCALIIPRSCNTN